MEIFHRSEMQDTSVGSLHYLITDPIQETKPFAIFLHGAHRELQNAEYWRPLFDIVGQRFNAVYVDLLGHGQSEFTDQSERVKPELQIIAILEFISHLQVTYPIGLLALVGRSYGGHIAVKVADELKHRVNGLVLIAPSVGSEIISLLGGWKGPTYCFWDAKDPVVNISNFSYVISALPQAKLYSVGNPASHNTFSKHKIFEHPTGDGTHVPEIEFKELFAEAFEDFYGELTAQ